ncbi:MAG: DoxX family protein [Flavobacterium sp.]|nr:DoxX family protein [Candidatus Neoflavobacterium equi]
MLHPELFAILLMLFTCITFVISSYEKIADWEGTLQWMTPLFEKTILKNKVLWALYILVFFEVITAALGIAGLFRILWSNDLDLAKLANLTAGISYLLMLIGQRLVKDFEGAKNLVIYFITCLLGVVYI